MCTKCIEARIEYGEGSTEAEAVARYLHRPEPSKSRADSRKPGTADGATRYG